MPVNNFNQIQEQIDKSFQDFISNLLRLSDDKLKYYYWSTEFFKNIGGLSFQYFTLNQGQKERINEKGIAYFNDSEVFLEVNKNSHRHDILIKYFNKLFSDDNKSGQSNRYEYIKEFVFLKILEELAKESNDFASEIVELQKKNFLLTYITYLVYFTKKPTFDYLNDYLKYTLTNKGQDLIKKLDELDAKGIKNSKLRNKLNKLFVLRSGEAKMHFVFSRAGGEEKEELRELLDVMGRKDTGNFYRGQANSTWKLDASIIREPKYLENEAEMYYEILSLKPDAFENDHTVYERLITMQHFGMPTRLLDITRNPLVAIFFASNNLECKNNDGVVFTFAPNKNDFLTFEDEKLECLKSLFDKSNGNSNDKEEKNFLSDISFVQGVAKNQRISSQSGDFIFVGQSADIQEKLYDLPALNIIIDAPTKSVLLEQLASLNIHGGSVYPDLTHMSNYISNKYKGDKLSEHKDFFDDIDLSPFDEEKKTTNKRPKAKRRSEIQQLSTTFNSEKFWTPKRKEEFLKFCNQLELNTDKTKDIIEKYLAFSNVPIYDVAIETMNNKPPLRERSTIGNQLTANLIELARKLGKITE